VDNLLTYYIAAIITIVKRFIVAVQGTVLKTFYGRNCCCITISKSVCHCIRFEVVNLLTYYSVLIITNVKRFIVAVQGPVL
jgi:hypothetical protein